MDNKRLGWILLGIGVFLALLVFAVKLKEDAIINQFIVQEGTCFLEDGTCLHDDRFIAGYIIGWFVSAVVLSLGIYLLAFEKSQKAIISALEKQKSVQSEEEKFNILMKGLNDDEKRIVRAVKEQDGITQQTLRLRADLHKSKLSILLDGLEKKGLIKRELKGKTKQVFLKVKL